MLWMLLMTGCLVLAAFLTWELARDYESELSLLLICFLLANCEAMLMMGNTAGIVVSLCVVAVWCFLEKRFVPAGVLCLAVGLAIKPHDAGLIWLYFLLAGGVYRKRALQTLLVVVALALPSILWISQVSPQWMQELRSNIAENSARGDLCDPGPTSIGMTAPDRIVDLQAVISVFRDDPHIYNPVSYLICGALLLVWTVRTLRSRVSQRNTWLALAAISAIAMLPVYHRQHDAKLLLLTIPACFMLWKEGGPIGRIALLVNTAGIVLTADIPVGLLGIFANDLHLSTAKFSGQILTIMLARPTTLALLSMGIFYLWVYVRHSNSDSENGIPQQPLELT